MGKIIKSLREGQRGFSKPAKGKQPTVRQRIFTERVQARSGTRSYPLKQGLGGKKEKSGKKGGGGRGRGKKGCPRGRLQTLWKKVLGSVGKKR